MPARPYVAVAGTTALCLCLCLVSAENARAEFLIGPNRHAYELVDDLVQWQVALVLATQRQGPAGYGNGHLATFSDQAEADFISANITVHGIIIGFTDEAREGEWRWIDDTTGIWQDPRYFANPIQTAYVKWAPNEPNGGTTENYGYFNWDRPGYFNDGKAQGGDPFRYLVEYELLVNPVPAPSGLLLLVSGVATGLVISVLRAFLKQTSQPMSLIGIFLAQVTRHAR